MKKYPIGTSFIINPLWLFCLLCRQELYPVCAGPTTQEGLAILSTAHDFNPEQGMRHYSVKADMKLEPVTTTNGMALGFFFGKLFGWSPR